jgi:hypothetical protein
LIHILKFVNHSSRDGFWIRPSNLVLKCSADASYLLHGNSKGHSGVLFWLGTINSPIDSICRKQHIVVGSSMEGELVALNECSSALTSLIAICRDLEMEQGLVLVEQDNQSLMECFANGYYDGTSKHINRRFDLVKQQLQDGVFKIVYVESTKILADHLTKPSVARFLKWRSLVLNEEEFNHDTLEDLFDQLALGFV